MIPDRDDRPGALRASRWLLETDEIEQCVARESVRAGLFRGARRAPTLGRYELVRRLGAGGMGVVFLAHDPRLDRPVALKVLREEVHEARNNELLLHEARSIARLQHPNVVAVYDADVERGRIFVAMEYVDGEPLDRWAASPRPWSEAVALLLQAGRGLAAAHAAGVVHRDFKPANVLIGKDGRARVADFGLAIAGAPAVAASPAEAGAAGASVGRAFAAANTVPFEGTLGAAGTPAYMAPEQILAGAADARSDQYSFCVSAFEILFGRRPFEAESLAELSRAMLERTPEFPEVGQIVPASLREALSRGLARVPQDRFPGMGALLEALERTLAEEPARRPAAPPAPATRPARSHGRCERYLAALPDGIESYPSCTTRASLIRLALTRRPLDGDAPAPAREALAHPSLRGERTLTTRARVLLVALFEQHFLDEGEWREFQRGLFRAHLSGSLRAMSMPSAGSSWALKHMARAFNDCHEGAPIALEPLGAGRARASVTWPPALYDDLFPIEIEACLRACFELSGARFFEFRPHGLTRESLDGTLVWR